MAHMPKKKLPEKARPSSYIIKEFSSYVFQTQRGNYELKIDDEGNILREPPSPGHLPLDYRHIQQLLADADSRKIALKENALEAVKSRKDKRDFRRQACRELATEYSKKGVSVREAAKQIENFIRTKKL